MKHTEEQTHILNTVAGTKDNILISALAGTGKTSTLEMVEKVAAQKPILYLVFNKRNADEATTRMPNTVTVRTFNSLGHRVWSSTRKVTLDTKGEKTKTILKGIIDAAPKTEQTILWSVYFEVLAGIHKAKALGYIPEGIYENAKRLITRESFHRALEETPDELTADLIDAVLKTSIKEAFGGYIDFNDQIYMPALFGGSFSRFPLIKVDEAQDLSPVNHALLDRLAKSQSRVIAVGDPWQNIYGFRGAKAQGMAELGARYNCVDTSLSVSFRCPQAIVENARWRVPHFKWLKAGGKVENLPKLRMDDIPDGAAILCRNNAPLFRTGLHLLAAGRSVAIAGSDIGPRIIGTMKKFGDADMKQAAVIDAIEQWREEKLAKDNKAAPDMADCMRVFAEFGSTLGTAISYAEHLLNQRGAIQLMTGHKSKGLEFPHVIHIDPWLIDQSQDQDKNLYYVIQTRTTNYYCEVPSAGIVP